jgi:hypothetical protein
MEQSSGSLGLEAARFLRRMLPCLVLVIAGCEWQRGERDVARVNDVAITKNDAVIELRAILWRRGESWNSLDETARGARRKEAVERCIEQHLVATLAARSSASDSEKAKASEQDFQQFLKQFEPPDGWKPRLDLQGVSEAGMRGRIAADVAQGSAIEQWLKEQRALSPETIEDAARKWFEQHRATMRFPERARVSHIFLTAHDATKPDRSAEIAELHRKLTAGEATFADLATKFSNDERSKKTGGSLGWIGRDRVPEDFGDAVFALPLQKPGAPFRTKLGWHIALVHERQAARLPEFAEVRDEIVARLDQPWREAAVKRLITELREKATVVVDEAELKTTEP